MKPARHLRHLSQQRQRRYRLRQKLGTRVCRITVPEDAIAEALIRSGRLTPDETSRHAEIERAVEVVVGDFVSEMLS